MSLGGKVCCVVEWLDGGESEQCENPQIEKPMTRAVSHQ